MNPVFLWDRRSIHKPLTALHRSQNSIWPGSPKKSPNGIILQVVRLPQASFSISEIMWTIPDSPCLTQHAGTIEGNGLRSCGVSPTASSSTSEPAMSAAKCSSSVALTASIPSITNIFHPVATFSSGHTAVQPNFSKLRVCAHQMARGNCTRGFPCNCWAQFQPVSSAKMQLLELLWVSLGCVSESRATV